MRTWAVVLAAGLPLAGAMPPEQQTRLVKKYCAVCHSDGARNGGLSLEHYDAAERDPALAAMLLSKLHNGAMNAAGLGLPDAATREAWVAATTAQAEGSREWSVMRGAVVQASIVREVAPRKAGTEAPLYRLTLLCEPGSGRGELQLSWSPEPQTDRTFMVSADGSEGFPHRLEGRERMGNGSAGTTGQASATLKVPFPGKTLTVVGLFPGETVAFPVGGLDGGTRSELAGCFPPRGSF